MYLQYEAKTKKKFTSTLSSYLAHPQSETVFFVVVVVVDVVDIYILLCLSFTNIQQTYLHVDIE